MLNTSSTEIPKSIMENLEAKSVMPDLTLSIAMVPFFGLQAAEVEQAEAKKNDEQIIVANRFSDIDARYNITDNLKVTVGASNRFDESPQDTVNSLGFSTFNQISPYSFASPYCTDT